MAAVLVALYEDFITAERVRTELVTDGFPTDRVELVSPKDPGAAAHLPGRTLSEKLRAYFETLFEPADGRNYPSIFAERVTKGASSVTVHPRGEDEIARAIQILERHQPIEIGSHALDDTTMERAAAGDRQTIVEKVIRGDTHRSP